MTHYLLSNRKTQVYINCCHLNSFHKIPQSSVTPVLRVTHEAAALTGSILPQHVLRIVPATVCWPWITGQTWMKQCAPTPVELGKKTQKTGLWQTSNRIFVTKPSHTTYILSVLLQKRGGRTLGSMKVKNGLIWDFLCRHNYTGQHLYKQLILLHYLQGSHVIKRPSQCY